MTSMPQGETPRFIIAGHWRSGTTYMSDLMTYFGFDVRHESKGKNGTCGTAVLINRWDVESCEELNRLLYEGARWTKLIQVVRNPWKVIESDHYLDRGCDQIVSWYPDIGTVTGLNRAIKSVVTVNRKISEFYRDLVMRVEDAPAILEQWLSRNDLLSETHGSLPSKTTNHKDHRALERKNWESVSPNIMEMLKVHCREYGYPECP